MRIRRLRIEHWRGVGENDVAFGDGVTIVTGPNEAGKSSLIEALLCLFRYPDDSRHRDVLSVRPVHVDASPAVALEAEFGDLRIDYRKRFGRGARSRETTLRIAAPGRNDETLTGREAHDRAEALLDERIDRHLWEALQIEQGAGIAQASLKDRRGLQEALDAAAGNDAGVGAEDGSLIERIDEEYARYFTSTGKARGAFARLPGAVAAAAEAHRQLESRIAELQDTADRHEALQSRIRQMERQLPELEAQARARDAERERVRALQRSLEQSTLALQAAGLARQQLVDERERRRELATGIDALVEASAAHDAQLERLDAEIATQQAALTQHRADRDGLVRARDAAAERRRRCQAALDLGRAVRERQRLEDTLRQVAAVDRKLDEARVLIAAFQIDDTDIAALRELQQAHYRAAAAAEAASPAVRIEALRDLELVVRGASRRLAAGEILDDAVNAGFAVKLPGVLDLTVSSTGEIEARVAEAQAAQAALDGRLRALGVESVTEAEARLTDRKAALSRVEALTGQRAGLLGDATADSLRARAVELGGEIDGLSGQLAGTGTPDDEDALRAALREAATDEQDAGTRIAALQVRSEPLESAITGMRDRRAELAGRREENRERIAADRDRLDASRAVKGDAVLDAELDRAAASLAQAETAHRETQAAYAQANPEQAEELATNATAALQRHRSDLDRQRVELGRLDGQLAQAHREGLFERLTDAAAVLEQREQDQARVARRAAAARRLKQVVGEHRAAASARYVEPLKERIDALGRLVFNASFAVDVDESLSIVSRSLDGVTVPFDSLSIGAQEQVGILARLAAAALVGRHAHVPLLMDDTLGYADETRLSTMGAAIARVARDNQVIILTCMPSRFAHVGDATTVSV